MTNIIAKNYVREQLIICNTIKPLNGFNYQRSNDLLLLRLVTPQNKNKFKNEHEKKTQNGLNRGPARRVIRVTNNKQQKELKELTKTTKLWFGKNHKIVVWQKPQNFLGTSSIRVVKTIRYEYRD